MSTILQSQFYKFNNAIKLIDGEDHKPVREKRDVLLKELEAALKQKSEKENKPKITFRPLNQGSYYMGNGVKPLHDDQDYDIDVRLAFDISKDDYNPADIKKIVRDAFDKLNRSVSILKPCVRVQYVEKGFPKFHIDFACYSEINKDFFGNQKTYLSKGRPGDDESEIFWEVSEPDKLKDKIDNAFRDKPEKREQYLRIIRAYKRWKDIKFNNTDKGKPTGIALTVMALQGFVPFIKDEFTGAEKIDDLKALIRFTNFILDQFGSSSGRISYNLPVDPGNDLFKKMTDAQCKTFKQKLETFKSVLEKVHAEPDPHEAAKMLQREFGDDFPVPPKDETGQKREKAIRPSNESA